MVASAQGEDRSDWNAVTGWTGLDFGFAKATEGTFLADPTFARNWANLKAAGIPRGAYHFFHPSEDAVAQARFFVKTVKAQGLERGDMLVVDSELLLDGVASVVRQARIDRADATLTPGEVDSRTKAFLDEAKTLVGHDNPLIVYTMHEVGQHLTETAAAYPLLWFAWPSPTAPDAALIAPWKKWTFWQWGTKNGIDADAFNGTSAALHTFLATYTHPEIVKIVRWRVWKFVTLAGAARRHHTTPEVMLRAAVKAGHVYKGAMKRYINRADWNKFLPLGTILFAFKKTKR